MEKKSKMPQKAMKKKEEKEEAEEEVEVEKVVETPKVVKVPTEQKEKSVDSKGSKGSKGSLGSKGSTGAKPVAKPVTKVAAKPTTISKPTAPIPKTQVVPKPPAQMTNAQVAQMQSIPQMPMPARRMMNNAYRQQMEPEVEKVPGVFNDDQPLLPLVKAEKEKAKEAAPYNLEANLEMEIKARQKIIKLDSKTAQLLPALVNIKTKEMTEEQEGDRSPIDLVCVIDISGSMSGEKIDLVRKTLVSLLELVNEHDRICLIQFDDRAERLTPLLRNDKTNLPIFTSKIGQLRDRGGTNIATGMNLAFKVLQERKESNPVTSIFLLTDGLDGGADQRVNAHLIKHKLLETTFTINCFGFGRDHDEDLLNNISKLKDGSFYFVDKLDTVDECFASALGGLMSVVALDINLFVTNAAFKPFDGIAIKRTFGEMWIKQGVTSGYQIKLAQLLAGSEKGFMLEIEIPPVDVKVGDAERNICILDAEFSAHDKSGKHIVKKNAKLLIHLINENEEIGEVDEDGQVLENYFRVKGSEAIEEAVNLANNGQYEEGSKRIEVVMDQIAKSKKVNQQKMQAVMTQLADSKNSCKPQVYAAVGKKCMVSNQKCFIEQKAGSNNMYSNQMQSKMVNYVKSKKAPQQMEEQE